MNTEARAKGAVVKWAVIWSAWSHITVGLVLFGAPTSAWHATAAASVAAMVWLVVRLSAWASIRNHQRV